MKKILIIEDSNEINELLKNLLKDNGFEVKSAYSGTEGLLYAKGENFDLILLDLMLPGMTGEEVLSALQGDAKPPVIVISAKTDISGKVELLGSGADDYITKPFDVREVLARVNLQISRMQKSQLEEKTTDIISVGDLEINHKTYKIKIAGNTLSLTRQEYNILHLLYSNPSKVFTKQELFNGAWEEYYVGEDKTINVHVSNIRNKIKEFSTNQYIETVWGIGFRAGIREVEKI